MSARPLRLPLLSCLAALAACGAGDQPSPTTPARLARPVTVFTAHASAPRVGGTIVGVAAPYREESIGFEVGGRVAFVHDMGKELDGPILDAAGNVVPERQGERIASLDDTRYRQALDAAKLKLASAQKGLEARQIEAEMAATSDLEQAEAKKRVAAQDLAAAQSSLELTRTKLQRTQELVDGGSASQAQLDADQNAYDNASATHESAKQSLHAADSALASARARAKLAQAQVEQALAQIAELEQGVVQATQNLTDCTLRAPYTGRITGVAVGRGGFVGAGTPVVTLTAMDPIKVSVTVGAERSRNLISGAQAALYPRDLERFSDAGVMWGLIFGKAEVADAATRTYRIDIIVRNLSRRAGAAQVDGRDVRVIDGFMPVLRETPFGDGPLFVSDRCLRSEDGQDFVYRVPGLVSGKRGRADITQVFVPERVAVERRDGRLTFITFTFVEIADGSSLTEGDVLIQDPQPEHLGGVVVERNDWAIRPGDLVPVSFDVGSRPRGIYVPVDAISNLNGRSSVFVVDGGRCRRVPVTVHETAGNLRRTEGDGVVEGAQIVLEGLHYLTDGDEVTVVETRELESR